MRAFTHKILLEKLDGLPEDSIEIYVDPEKLEQLYQVLSLEPDRPRKKEPLDEVLDEALDDLLKS